MPVTYYMSTCSMQSSKVSLRPPGLGSAKPSIVPLSIYTVDFLLRCGHGLRLDGNAKALTQKKFGCSRS